MRAGGWGLLGCALACGVSGADARSPVPPDAPCTSIPGQVVTLYSGNVESFAVDDSYVYVAARDESTTSSALKMARVPLAGGAPTPIVSAPGVR